VGQVLHGGAGRVVRRKLDASLGSFTNVALTVLVALVLVVVVAGRPQVAAMLRRVPGLREAALALGLLALLGTFLNDSGVVVGGTVLMLTVLAIAASGLAPEGVPRAPTGQDDVVVPAAQERSP
jgi:hypothetical protein